MVKLHIFWRNKLASPLNFTPFHRYFSRLHQIQQQLRHIINNRHNKTNPKQCKRLKGDWNRKITQHKERLKNPRPRVQDLSSNMTQIDTPLHTQFCFNLGRKGTKETKLSRSRKSTVIANQHKKPTNETSHQTYAKILIIAFTNNAI